MPASEVLRKPSLTCASPTLTDYFRCPGELAQLPQTGQLSATASYFRFGPDVVGYGRSLSSTVHTHPGEVLENLLRHLRQSEDGESCLPFDAEEVLSNLRNERYLAHADWTRGAHRSGWMRDLYYMARPLLPLPLRKHLHRIHLRGWNEIPFPHWPVDVTADVFCRRLLALSLTMRGESRVPFIWFWPKGASAAAVMTHDVEAEAGKRFCKTLMDIDESFSIPASFQIVPEKRYEADEAFLRSITERGFEVNVQDLNHDGRLFESRRQFEERASKINDYARKFGAIGFRAAILYRNQEWFDKFDFEYDTSVPNVAHLDPQRGGCCTVMPYFIGKILELPVTMTQDHSLFHVLNDYSLTLWKQQAEIVLQQNGLINFIVHPDYLLKERAQEAYKALLGHINELRSERDVWVAKPGDVNRWWRQRSNMELKQDGGGQWRIVGQGGDQACVAFAELDGETVKYTSPSLMGGATIG